MTRKKSTRHQPVQDRPRDIRPARGRQAKTSSVPYPAWCIPSQFPWTPKEFWFLPWQRARLLARWFIDSIPARVAALERLVSSSPGFEGWRADTSRRSFERLGPWVVSRLGRSAAKKADWPRGAPDSVLNPHRLGLPARGADEAPGYWVYEDQALARSVLADIGSYLGASLRGQAARARWSRCTDPHHPAYNQASLIFEGESVPRFSMLHEPWRIAASVVNRSDAPDAFARALDLQRSVRATRSREASAAALWPVS